MIHLCNSTLLMLSGIAVLLLVHQFTPFRYFDSVTCLGILNHIKLQPKVHLYRVSKKWLDQLSNDRVGTAAFIGLMPKLGKRKAWLFENL